MKFSDIIMYIMKIMLWGLKRILSSRLRDIRYIEFKNTEFFTSHGGYLLNTTL